MPGNGLERCFPPVVSPLSGDLCAQLNALSCANVLRARLCCAQSVPFAAPHRRLREAPHLPNSEALPCAEGHAHILHLLSTACHLGKAQGVAKPCGPPPFARLSPCLSVGRGGGSAREENLRGWAPCTDRFGASRAELPAPHPSSSAQSTRKLEAANAHKAINVGFSNKHVAPHTEAQTTQSPVVSSTLQLHSDPRGSIAHGSNVQWDICGPKEVGPGANHSGSHVGGWGVGFTE